MCTVLSLKAELESKKSLQMKWLYIALSRDISWRTGRIFCFENKGKLGDKYEKRVIKHLHHECVFYKSGYFP